jgi:hypothetical protein
MRLSAYSTAICAAGARIHVNGYEGPYDGRLGVIEPVLHELGHFVAAEPSLRLRLQRERGGSAAISLYLSLLSPLRADGQEAQALAVEILVAETLGHRFKWRQIMIPFAAAVAQAWTEPELVRAVETRLRTKRTQRQAARVIRMIRAEEKVLKHMSVPVLNRILRARVNRKMVS